MMVIPASSIALVWNSLGVFLSFLNFQISPRTCATSQVMGSSRSSWSWPKSRRTSCCGLRAGMYTLSLSSSQSATSMFWGHVSRECWSWSGVCSWDWEHLADPSCVVFLVLAGCCAAFSREKWDKWLYWELGWWDQKIGSNLVFRSFWQTLRHIDGGDKLMPG